MPETAERPDLSIGLWGNNFVASVQNSQDGSSMPFSALRTDARDFLSQQKSPKSLCEACRAKNALLPPKPHEGFGCGGCFVPTVSRKCPAVEIARLEVEES